MNGVRWRRLRGRKFEEAVAFALLLVVKQMVDEKMGAEVRPCVAEECYSLQDVAADGQANKCCAHVNSCRSRVPS
jgi:hypothetical protein